MEKFFIKINNSLIRNPETNSTNSKDLIVLLYFLFNKNTFNNINTTIMAMCSDLMFSTNSYSKESAASKIQNSILNLVNLGYITIDSCVVDEFNKSINKNKMFTVHVNVELSSPSKNFTILYYDEFVKIKNIANGSGQKLQYLINVYMVIKSYINMAKDSIGLCTMLDNEIAIRMMSDRRLVSGIVEDLVNSKILHRYNIYPVKKTSSSKSIVRVLSINQYVKEDVDNFIDSGFKKLDICRDVNKDVDIDVDIDINDEYSVNNEYDEHNDDHDNVDVSALIV